MALLPLCQIDLAKDTDPRASCSDAAESGGGVCVSKSLTARGRARLQETKAFVRGMVADSLFLVEHCGGIGAARRALEILGVRPGGHLATEVLEPAIRVQLEAYPGVVCCGNLEDFSAAKFEDAIREVPCLLFLWEAAATLRRDLSGAIATRQGLAEIEGKLFGTLEEEIPLQGNGAKGEGCRTVGEHSDEVG